MIIIIWSLCEELLSDPELLSSFVSFYLMDLHVFTFPTQPWSDFSISHIPLRKPCRCFVQSLFFSSYFLLFIHQIVSAFPDWCWTQLVVSFFTQMFTRLKLTVNSLGSSVSTLLSEKLLGHWTWDCSPVRAVFYSSVVFFLIYKMWEIVVVIYRNVIQVARVNGSRWSDCTRTQTVDQTFFYATEPPWWTGSASVWLLLISSSTQRDLFTHLPHNRTKNPLAGVFCLLFWEFVHFRVLFE